jgi:ABC-type nitrate/sulfonate/bicarbonate transport system substrate-binding protein
MAASSHRMRCSGKRPSFVLVAGAVLAAAAAGFLLNPNDGSPAQSAPSSLSASLRLNAPFDPSFAGAMAAARGGLFEREGLKIELKPGDRNPIDLVASGADTIGLAGADAFLLAREKGLPIVAFAAGYLESPIVFFALEGSSIRTPTDFLGKRIGYQATETSAIIYQALMAKLELSRSRVQEVAVGTDVAPFVNGAVDVWPGAIGAPAYALSQKGVQYRIIRPANYGVHVPGTVYFTTDKVVHSSPSLIRRFLRAIIDGWDMTDADYEKSVPLLASFDPRLTPELIRFTLEQQRDFVRPVGRRTGEFDLVQWRSLRQILLQQKLLQGPVDLSQAVTLDFLRDVYRKPITFGK